MWALFQSADQSNKNLDQMCPPNASTWETHLFSVRSETRETLVGQLRVKIIEGLLFWSIGAGILNCWWVATIVRRVRPTKNKAL